jgi:hypothetical protein
MSESLKHPFFIKITWHLLSRGRLELGLFPVRERIGPLPIAWLDIISAIVLPIDNDHIGQVRGGYIRLSRMLVHGRLSRTYRPGSPNPGSALEVAEVMMFGVICRPDDGFSFAVPLPHVIYCLPILRDPCWKYKGLLLVPSGHEGEFKRYGTFTTSTIQNRFLISCTPRFESGPLGRNGRYEL